MHIPKIDDYLEILTTEEVKEFEAITFSQYYKSINEEQNLGKVPKSLYIFLTTPAEVNKYVQSNSDDNCMHHYNVEIFFDADLQLFNTKPVTKNQLKTCYMSWKSLKFRQY